MKILIYILFPFLTFAQSNGISHAQFTKQLANMTHDLSIVNNCEASEKFRFELDTLNMNFHDLELFNTEIIVGKIINPGEIIYHCGSVTIEVSKNYQQTSHLEVNYYADYYGYTARLIDDTIHINSKSNIEGIKIIDPVNNSSFWHSEYDQKNVIIPLEKIPKGNYIVALSINRKLIVNILNHQQKSKKP